jgi:hypothetical protein
VARSNPARIGIAISILILAVYLVSPKGVGLCPIPPGSLGTCTAVSSTVGKTSFSCSGGAGVSCSAPLLSYPYILLPFVIVVAAASFIAFLLSWSKGKTHGVATVNRSDEVVRIFTGAPSAHNIRDTTQIG